MAVTFHIPGGLRDFTSGNAKIQVQDSPATVRDALSALWALYPGVRDRLMNEQGQVREHINIFVGEENIRYLGGLSSPVPPESEISIVPAVSGGNLMVRVGKVRAQGCADLWQNQTLPLAHECLYLVRESG